MNRAYSFARSLRHDAGGERTYGCVASWRGSLSLLGISTGPSTLAHRGEVE
jgi:hypothetical protein